VCKALGLISTTKNKSEKKPYFLFNLSYVMFPQLNHEFSGVWNTVLLCFPIRALSQSIAISSLIQQIGTEHVPQPETVEGRGVGVKKDKESHYSFSGTFNVLGETYKCVLISA
jgi:hypothetical protein